MQQRLRVALILAALVAIGAAFWWWMSGRGAARHELALYGNIDLRQIELPFNGSERIAEVLVQEGDHVKQGQLLARLDTSRLSPQVAKAQADVAAQQQASIGCIMATGRRRSRRRAPTSAAAAADAAMRARNTSGCHAFRTLSRPRRQPAGSRCGQAAPMPRSQASGQPESAGARACRTAARRMSRRRDAQLRADQAAARAAAAAAQGCRSARAARCGGALAHGGAGRNRFAAEDRLYARHHRSEVGARLCRGDRIWVWCTRACAAAVTVDGFPGRQFLGLGRLHLVRSRSSRPSRSRPRELRSSLVYEMRVFVHDPGDQLRLGCPPPCTCRCVAAGGA